MQNKEGRLDITRRRILSTGVQLTAAMTLGSGLAQAGARGGGRRHRDTFFDERFPESRVLAAGLPDAASLEAIGGDPSHLVGRLAAAEAAATGLHLQGVTTESIPFCLQQLTRHRPDVRFESRRVDQDLFAWSLELAARTPA